MPKRTSRDSSKDSLARTESADSEIGPRKTDIQINVYDLLPPSKLCSVLWTVGVGLYHSGVVVGDREYAYGGHDRPGLSGVYYTQPRLVPPHATYRTTVSMGFVEGTEDELVDIIEEAKNAFMGTSYNLLTKNCNHFTTYLCQRLIGKPAPKWLNRAAGIGGSLPCMVPRDWIEPPEYETAEGELPEDESDFSEDERAQMLSSDAQQRQKKSAMQEDEFWADEAERMYKDGAGHAKNLQGQSRGRYADEGPSRPVKVDTSGRDMPAAERAPLPHSGVRMK